MSLSMHQASIPVFVRAFGVLSRLLDKAVEHARAHGQDPNELLTARLAPDMFTLVGQVQRASDTAKATAERLSGVPAPSMPDTEASFPELQERIAKTVAYLESVDPARFEGSEQRTIELPLRDFKPVFRGDGYLFTFALPNFYFHVTTAYGILRHKGVQIGKRDFLGPYTPPANT
ncbi:DUF1993 domain-containing protein [Myxococcus sp. K15C18031901]|uniref:DUF1993 domain-containing protein n=1 Tax=Myxococcus dinghuensis TaxID=2906761 RepID=UPI0020A7841C|nr:DUF1993 domain-containing protein [Myxococcus dinghuensis]MCP3104563.1 DUF1993 domain-containing protein [Myxococcus dinghuensis]